MSIYTKIIKLSTKGYTDIIDITEQVNEAVKISGVTDGFTVVFIPGSTGAITTIEYESGALEDLKEAIERLAPQSLSYHHDKRWHDGNGFSHVRAAILGPSVTIPITHGSLHLGTWQQIVLIDMDNRPRDREIIVKILGET
ncbi:MAG: secondary thiamine-phosphate synthase enzyme YjbQ [bacterium]